MGTRCFSEDVVLRMVWGGVVAEEIVHRIDDNRAHVLVADRGGEWKRQQERFVPREVCVSREGLPRCGIGACAMRTPYVHVAAIGLQDRVSR